jgi:hypothetical protein
MISAKKARELCSDVEFTLVGKSFPGLVMDVPADEARSAVVELHRLMAGARSRTRLRLFREAHDRFKTRLGMASDDEAGRHGPGPLLSKDPMHLPPMKVKPSKQAVSRQRTVSGHMRAAQKRQQARRDSRP